MTQNATGKRVLSNNKAEVQDGRQSADISIGRSAFELWRV